MLLLASCFPYKVPTEACVKPPAAFPAECKERDEDIYFFTAINKEEAAHHWLYNVIPRHRCQIEWYDVGHWCTWMLFGNDDDGIFGEEITAKFHPEREVSTFKALAWNIRNPLHNFCFYVIGTAYMGNSEITLLKVSPRCFSALTYKPVGDTTFADDYTSLYVALHGYKPFVSFRLAYNRSYKSDFYVGWRCRGNFGIKCVLLTKRKNPRDKGT